MEGIFAATHHAVLSGRAHLFPQNRGQHGSLLAQPARGNGRSRLNRRGGHARRCRTREVLRASVEAAAPEKVLIAGVGRESVKGTVELAEAAAELQYDAVLVRPPSYYADQSPAPAMLHYFRSVADRSPLPVILYNIPKCVPYQIPIELIAELAAAPQHHRHQGFERQS